ncbi:acetyl-CoA carboxylase biotin carboxyl carrier protein [Lederbergia lenta]|uniref:Biotin carboxyl carrier protein of acetyl-CoA carboxylase n=1 Tax=Lederbergia lenta TaxID=1467 RepID=A0A2X4VZF7_LEDLE|nr:acetyl-CoA carboxylase biotin carboxyl carrier protein [Lederbergia lenta]MCM3111473.1 acetyl-CoA carboxylase biotin carboxyl carrier protein [Lederbergia lenta]MEC2325140.1 acetyl-CoA carboxylase biotin carboxyl carrier protein [Lederbergia lenta]SQI56221.1 acetyl-CoA carboxylase biotin carboxyl carrier protein subunit [Lederbergia lenta]
MLKIQEIRELIKLIDQSDIEEFVFEHDGSKIEMKKNVGAAQVQSVLPAASVAQAPTIQAAVSQPMNIDSVATVTTSQVEAASQQSDVDTSNLHTVTSPMVGTYYQSSSPETPPYVQVGSQVKEDSVVCIVEAMKLFNEIEAEVEGEIVEVLVENGQLVEYGQPLYLVKPR